MADDEKSEKAQKGKRDKASGEKSGGEKQPGGRKARAQQAAAAAPEDATDARLLPVIVLPEDDDPDSEGASPQLAAPAGAFALEQAVSLRRGTGTGFAVLTKLVEQGPGFDLYEFVPVS